eukprot:scaffold10659_cov96-Isochrysis_galbana.AAC.2
MQKKPRAIAAQAYVHAWSGMHLSHELHDHATELPRGGQAELMGLRQRPLVGSFAAGAHGQVPRVGHPTSLANVRARLGRLVRNAAGDANADQRPKKRGPAEDIPPHQYARSAA